MFQRPVGPLLAIFESPANLESDITKMQNKESIYERQIVFMKGNGIRDGMPSGPSPYLIHLLN